MDTKTTENVKDLSDDDLFKLLDTVSEEVKRRNNLIAPPISNIRSNSIEDNLKLVIGALSDLGLKTK